MGISGLLPFLENASKKSHVSQFKGSTAAIDSYCWLHRGAIGCAEKLARGEDTNGYVVYCMKYIRMLQLHGIRPIMVFDGQHLPAKKITEEKRRKQRHSSKQKAAEMLRLGNNVDARRFLMQSIDISHKMALALIKECRSNGIDCIVAPYEADAQLAYLNLSNLADFVISEDSDLLLFGCKKIFFKMDIHGHGTMVDADKINDCMKLRPHKFTFDKFKYMCILSGCDYLENLPGVGLKKALKFISVTENPSIYNALPKLPAYLKLSNVVVTDEYRNNFMLADATFRHQIVFDPRKRHLLPLNPITSETNTEHCKNAGDMTDNELAFQLALGNIDPFSHKKVDDWNPDACSLPILSIWSKGIYKSKDISKPTESTTRTPKRPAPTTKNKVVIAETSQNLISHDSEIDEMLDMYRKMGPVKKPEVTESKDLYTLVHGDVDKTTKRCSSGFLKFGPTVVDYKNCVHSPFFKPKDEVPKSENQGPMVSLLGAIDNLIQKRKTVESDTNIDKSPEIVSKRRKSDLENELDNDVENKCESTITNLKKKFHFKKEKLQCLKKKTHINIKEHDDNHINTIESVTVVEIEVDKTSESLRKETDDGANKQKPAETIVTKSITKKQTTLLNFFGKR